MVSLGHPLRRPARSASPWTTRKLRLSIEPCASRTQPPDTQIYEKVDSDVSIKTIGDAYHARLTGTPACR